MKKTIFFSTVAFVIGALIQDKYNVIDKAKDLYGKTKDTISKKYSECKEKVKENIEELKEEASETVNDEKPIEENGEK